MNVLQHAKETAPQTGTRCLGLRKCFVLHTRRYPTQIALQHAQDIILIVIFAGTNRLHHIQRIRGSIQSSTLASLRLFLRIPDHSKRRSEDGTIMHEITKYYRESPDLALPGQPKLQQNLIEYLQLRRLLTRKMLLTNPTFARKELSFAR